MAGKFSFTLEEYQEAAHRYRKDLLKLPVIAAKETLQFMTGRPGIRYKESVGMLTGDAQFAPYKKDRVTNYDLNLDLRTIETFFGSVVADFEPNSAISTLMGIGATKGDGQMATPTAREVLALIASNVGEHLNDHIWDASRNPNGDTTKDLFDGFDTITAKEIDEGNIAAGKGNYLKLSAKIDNTNAVEIAKQILFDMDPRLRAQTCYLYCSQDFLDKYNEAYLLTHGATPYNQKYQQTFVEGSGGKLIFCPLYNKAGSNFIHIAPKVNMLYGYDSMSDQESILVKEYKPFVLSYIATMFFGTQFESIDKRRLKVVELADGDSNTSGTVETPASITIKNSLGNAVTAVELGYDDDESTDLTLTGGTAPYTVTAISGSTVVKATIQGSTLSVEPTSSTQVSSLARLLIEDSANHATVLDVSFT